MIGVLFIAYDSGGGGGGGIASTYSLFSLDIDGDDVSPERMNDAQLALGERYLEYNHSVLMARIAGNYD